MSGVPPFFGILFSSFPPRAGMTAIEAQFLTAMDSRLLRLCRLTADYRGKSCVMRRLIVLSFVKIQQTIDAISANRVCAVFLTALFNKLNQGAGLFVSGLKLKGPLKMPPCRGGISGLDVKLGDRHMLEGGVGHKRKGRP